jgi:hypothetical protein
MASNIVHYSELLHIAVNGACLLANEKPETKSIFTDFRLEIVFEKSLTEEKLLLLRKVKAPLRVLASNWKQNFIMLIPKPATFPYAEPREPTHIYPLYFFCFNLILLSVSQYSKWQLSFVFSSLNFVCVFHLSCTCCMPHPFHSQGFGHHNIC